MKAILLVACLAACGTNEPDPHDLGACGGGWQAYNGNSQDFFAGKSCERACNAPPPNYLSTTAPKCTVGSNAPVPNTSCAYFEDVDGTKGCCITESGLTAEGFFECEPQP